MPRRLSLHEYQQSMQIEMMMKPFYSLIAAAMRQADSDNLVRLKQAFPYIFDSLKRRYDALLGVVEEWDGMTVEEYANKA